MDEAGGFEKDPHAEVVESCGIEEDAEADEAAGMEDAHKEVVVGAAEAEQVDKVDEADGVEKAAESDEVVGVEYAVDSRWIAGWGKKSNADEPNPAAEHLVCYYS
ncbi:hypothetical protein FQN54_007393 [Arachnomyces sp. PD_36]|nr:hypothetical protein FQN54_007393 [Arachnomyces sp. PD_36]